MKLLLIFTLLQTISVSSQDSISDTLINKTENNTKEEINALLELSDYYYNQENYLEAIKTTLKAKKYSKTKPNDSLTAIIEKNLSQYYLLAGAFDKSLKYSFKSLTYFNKTTDTLNMISCIGVIGNTYTEIADYPEALKYYKQALVLVKAINNNRILFSVYNNIGIVYDCETKHEAALEYYQKALHIQRKYLPEMQELKSNILINIGMTKKATKKYNEALKLYNQALEIAIKNKENRRISTIYFNKAEVYNLLANYDSSFQNIQKSLDYANENVYNWVLSESYLLISSLYKKRGDLNHSYLYLQKHINCKDSLINIKKLGNIAKIKLINETNKKELEIEQLEMANKLDKIKLKTYKNRLIFIVLLSLMSIVILSGFLFYKIRIRKALFHIVGGNIKSMNDKKEIKRLKQLVKSQNPSNNNKYLKSSLDKDEKERITEIIEKALNEDKIFLDPNLTLEKFADISQTNRTYFSQVLNENFHKSFNDLINEYRTEEAKNLLISDYSSNYTLEAISKKVGFNSISTFNRIFKKHTGITPSFFLNIYKKNLKK